MVPIYMQILTAPGLDNIFRRLDKFLDYGKFSELIQGKSWSVESDFSEVD